MGDGNSDYYGRSYMGRYYGHGLYGAKICELAAAKVDAEIMALGPSRPGTDEMVADLWDDLQRRNSLIQIPTAQQVRRFAREARDDV